MINTDRLTASHVRYLLALKKLYRPDGIRSMDVAEELEVTRTSVHEMMDAFIRMNYIKKEHGGQVYMTPFGLQQAIVFEERYQQIKTLLFADHRIDASPNKAIYTLIADMSDECALLLQ